MAVSQGKVILNSNGQAWRPHLYIEDVCEAFRCCVEWDYDGEELLVLNVGRNDNNWRIIDLAKKIQQEIDGCKLEFLTQESTEQDELVKDRKIQDGVDTRTYQVNFDRIHKHFRIRCSLNVEAGIKKLLEELERWELDEIKFKQRDFYRLQQVEYLHQTKQLDDNLFWAK